MRTKNSRYVIVAIVMAAAMALGLAAANATTVVELTGDVKSIVLTGGGTSISWTTDGNSAGGFKVVWSKNENPTYPTREGDRYHYYTDPAKNSDILDAFNGVGDYYVRVCEYLGGKCGVYSNQIKLTLSAAADQCVKKDNKCCLGDKCETVMAKCVAGSVLKITGCDSGCLPKFECAATSKKCAAEGQKTSGPVSPQYYYGCCAGLKSFYPYKLLVGAGSICYNPSKGEPVCRNAGMEKEGWYYPNNGKLLKLENCDNSNDSADSKTKASNAEIQRLNKIIKSLQAEISKLKKQIAELKKK